MGVTPFKGIDQWHKNRMDELPDDAAVTSVVANGNHHPEVSDMLVVSSTGKHSMNIKIDHKGKLNVQSHRPNH